jgi:chloramphenicol-sensitive protein RarD
MTRHAERSGLLYGISAYGLWGLVPLYFRALRLVTAQELLAQRIVWATLLLALITFAIRGWGLVRRSLTVAKTRRTLILTSVLIGVNWYLYIYAASTDQVVEASLGYFIAPLVNTALGVVVLRERLRRLQVLAIALAGLGVMILTVQQGKFPWLALGLALSFSVYGLLRKTVAAEALTGLVVESLLLTPIALAYLGWIQWTGEAKFGRMNFQTDLLLAAASVVTVVPLFCFAQAARRLRLTTIGFLQFLSPTVQFLLAITLLGEPFNEQQFYGFAPIWLALVVYTMDAALKVRRPIKPLPALRPDLPAATP